MIIFFIFLILTIIGSILIIKDLSYGANFIKKMINHFCGILIAIFITGLFTPMVWGVVGKLFIRNEPYSEKITYDLVSINDGSNLSGSFILGTGQINDKLVYNYYRKDESGGIVRRSISANLTTIYEVDSLETPRIDIHIVPLVRESWWFPIVGTGGRQKYDLYLPAGSIIKEVKLDNE